jgi:hypothetical protein
MASDPFFDSLIAANVAASTSREVGDLTEHDEEVDPGLVQQEGDVDEWFEQAASGRGGGVVDARPPADQLGAAALPIDGDLVRPRRRPLTRHRGRTPPSLPDGADRQATSVAQPRRLRLLAVVALATAALLAAVGLATWPASPGPPSANPKPAPGPTPAVVSTRSSGSASQQASDQARSRRAARALKLRRAAAAERRRHLAAQRRRAAARRRAARSAAAARRRAPARAAPAPTPTVPRRRVSPSPPAPARRPSVSPVCAEFPPC